MIRGQGLSYELGRDTAEKVVSRLCLARVPTTVRRLEF